MPLKVKDPNTKGVASLMSPGTGHMHRFSVKGHEIKKDISVLLGIVSFSGGSQCIHRLVCRVKEERDLF